MNHLGAGRRFYNDLTGGGRRKHAKTHFLLRLRWGHVTGALGVWGGYLHCRRAQNMPVFLLMVDASELATRNCP